MRVTIRVTALYKTITPLEEGQGDEGLHDDDVEETRQVVVGT